MMPNGIISQPTILVVPRDTFWRIFGIQSLVGRKDELDLSQLKAFVGEKV